MTALDIPYEPQRRVRANRLCGAAALTMVFRSLGLACSQEEVWEEIARPDRTGTRAARTYLLAASALKRGLTAMVLQARRPWPILEEAMRQGIRVILNQRVRAESCQGHFTVLVAVDDVGVVVHDPHFGPRRRLTREELDALWQPPQGGAEIIGHVLVAFGGPDAVARLEHSGRVARPELNDGRGRRESPASLRSEAVRNRGRTLGCCVSGPTLAQGVECLSPFPGSLSGHAAPTGACRLCGSSIPAAFTCSTCGQEAPLQPGSLLGCLHATCPRRLWARIFCPGCDRDYAALSLAGRPTMR